MPDDARREADQASLRADLEAAWNAYGVYARRLLIHEPDRAVAHDEAVSLVHSALVIFRARLSAAWELTRELSVGETWQARSSRPCDYDLMFTRLLRDLAREGRRSRIELLAGRRAQRANTAVDAPVAEGASVSGEAFNDAAISEFAENLKLSASRLRTTKTLGRYIEILSAFALAKRSMSLKDLHAEEGRTDYMCKKMLELDPNYEHQLFGQTLDSLTNDGRPAAHIVARAAAVKP